MTLHLVYIHPISSHQINWFPLLDFLKEPPKPHCLETHNSEATVKKEEKKKKNKLEKIKKDHVLPFIGFLCEASKKTKHRGNLEFVFFYGMVQSYFWITKIKSDFGTVYMVICSQTMTMLGFSSGSGKFMLNEYSLRGLVKTINGAGHQLKLGHILTPVDFLFIVFLLRQI